MSRSKLFLTASVIAVILFSSFGCSRHRCSHFSMDTREKMIEFAMEKISDELQLTEEQQTRLNQIKDEIVTKHKPMQTKMEDAFDFLQSEIKKDRIDETLLKNKMEDIHAGKEEMHSFMLSKFVEFHTLLTKEQKEILAGKLNKFNEYFFNK
ncbi:MAG: Spy/CpxP family protein refolding chaperone [bacterium]